MPTSSLHSSAWLLRSPTITNIYSPITCKYILFLKANDIILYHDFVCFCLYYNMLPLSPLPMNILTVYQNRKNPFTAPTCQKTIKYVKISIFFLLTVKLYLMLPSNVLYFLWSWGMKVTDC